MKFESFHVVSPKDSKGIVFHSFSTLPKSFNCRTEQAFGHPQNAPKWHSRVRIDMIRELTSGTKPNQLEQICKLCKQWKANINQPATTAQQRRNDEVFGHHWVVGSVRGRCCTKNAYIQSRNGGTGLDFLAGYLKQCRFVPKWCSNLGGGDYPESFEVFKRVWFWTADWEVPLTSCNTWQGWYWYVVSHLICTIVVDFVDI